MFCLPSDLLRYADENTRQRFIPKVNIGEIHDCWQWVASHNMPADRRKKGYGLFRYNGKQEKSHRIAWELSCGHIPEGMLVLNRCDNPICVNPNHLFLGTHQDNMTDMASKGRCNPTHIYGEENRTSKLTSMNVAEIRELYATQKYSLKDLGRMYNVSSSNIRKVVRHMTWTNGEKTVPPAHCVVGKKRYVDADKRIQSKLTYDLADAARAEYAAGGTTLRALAEKYGVSSSVIRKVIHHVTYRRP